jgi:holo-[acyl-carrier protein] synthase
MPKHRVKATRGRIIGHGLDVVDIADFSRLMDEPTRAFLDRYFTESELAAAGNGANQIEKLAGRFAIKEAVLKALGVGWGDGVAFRDVEVVTLGSAAPTIRLHRQLAALEREREIVGWFVSASHTSVVAMASAIAMSE